MDYRIIQQIAAGVVETSAACDGQLYTGKVTSASPLKISLGEDAGSIELEGDDIILTAAVVSKKIYINKHTHSIGNTVKGHKHAVSGSCSIIVTPPTPISGEIIGDASASSALEPNPNVDDTVLDGYCTEYGHKLPVDSDKDKIVITINRSLEKGDAVIMTRVSHGQQFIVLSRYFEVDKAGGDDD